ncbi:MAG: DUF3784 domain-containing protein [Defluviitaleaceae bacterium]|nr:DUF3784 domain-containing protein [Defluviitaleaceae bacterium]MCL2263612.1 DUF3784 domain-containing protein [Defluviitaleaceae bacterium]
MNFGISFMINTAIAVSLIACGVLLLRGKGGFLLAGWNTASEAERAKYNKKALFTFSGWMVIVVAVLAACIPFASFFADEHGNLFPLLAVIILICAIPLAGVVYINVSKRFRATNEENCE